MSGIQFGFFSVHQGAIRLDFGEPLAPGWFQNYTPNRPSGAKLRKSRALLVKWSGLVSGVYFVAVLGTTLVDLGWDSNEISMILASFWLNCWWSFCVICLLIYCAHGPFPPTPAAEFQAFRVWFGPDTGPVRGPRPLWQPLNGEDASTLEFPTIFNENR